jgi:hypothetical protein
MSVALKRAEAKGRSAEPLHNQWRFFRFWRVSGGAQRRSDSLTHAMEPNSASDSASALRSLGVGMSRQIEHECDTSRAAPRALAPERRAPNPNVRVSRSSRIAHLRDPLHPTGLFSAAGCVENMGVGRGVGEDCDYRERPHIRE